MEEFLFNRYYMSQQDIVGLQKDIRSRRYLGLIAESRDMDWSVSGFLEQEAGEITIATILGARWEK
jgi:hypothetical protein